MAPRITIADIRAEDVLWKPGGTRFDEDALKLSMLADHRGRSLMYNHLKAVGMGDPDNVSPLVIGAIPRLMESLSVLYRVPATRRLKRGENILEDDDPQAVAFSQLAHRMCLDNVWQLVDAERNLLRQCVISFVESHARKSVQARIIEPQNVYRRPSASEADSIEQDEAVALLIRDSVRPADQRYQLWEHDDGGAWRCWIVDGGSSLVGEQPYGEGGAVPFDEVPLLQVYDDLPAGNAWLPIPESRLDFTLNISALANDLAYLIKLEAHTIKTITSPDPKGVPTQVGPGALWTLPDGSKVETLATSPHIEESSKTIERLLAMLAMAESLPPDYFSATRAVHTGPALKTAERDLEARRQRQQPLAVQDERRAFAKIRAIHNRYAADWGLDALDEDLVLVTSFSRQWQPIDVRELQQAAGFDLAIGTASVIDYIQERYNCDRSSAIDLYRQVQADREAYPVQQQQNPAALISGTNPALGPEGSAKTPGAFNPELATSTEGASLVDAVRRSHDVQGEPVATPPPSSGASVSTLDAGAPAKAQDTALNGAQVEAAVGIIEKVAEGALPRSSGLAMLVEFFNLDPAAAERLMGPVGQGFEARAPAPEPTTVAFPKKPVAP